MDSLGKSIQQIVGGSHYGYDSEDEDTAPLCPPSSRTNGNKSKASLNGRHCSESHHHGGNACLSAESNDHDLPNGDIETHCHSWWPEVDFSEDAVAIRQLVFVSILCFLFMTAQIIGGAVANSLSIMTDAAHLSSDLASFLISILALYLKRRRPTKRFSFGYHRVETLGALISILVIWLLSAILCILAIERIQRHEFDINANEMLIVASLGVAFNIVMGIVLHSDVLGTAQKYVNHGHSHGGGGHSHGTSAVESGHSHENHGHSHRHGSQNINIRAAFIHVIGDLVQSVGVLVAAILIKIEPDWKLADPICTFVFSVIVLCTTLTVLRDIIIILVEAVPNGVDYDFIRKELGNIPGVGNVHNLHIWNLSTSNRLAVVHLTVNDINANRTTITRLATKILVSHADVRSATIQIEESLSLNASINPEIADGTGLGFVDNSAVPLPMDCNHCRRFTPL